MTSIDIIKDIQNAKKKLIRRALRSGIYENFGEKEERELRDKWSRYFDKTKDTDDKIRNEMNKFFEWRINFDDVELRKAR
jgi:hypothetical protein